MMVISVPVSQLGCGGSTLEVTPGVTLSDSVCDGAEYKPLKGLKATVVVARKVVALSAACP